MADFKKEWFNPLFWILLDIVDNRPEVDKITIYGGKSSAKTVSVCQIMAIKGYTEKISSMLFRKESTRVKTTIKKSFELAVKTTRMDEAWETQDRMFKCVKGSEAILTGLDDAEKAKGVEGTGFVLMDELNHFTKGEFDQVDLALRGEGKKVLFSTFNPISEDLWCKTEFIDTYVWEETDYKLPDSSSFVKISSCGTHILIRTSYKDNYWSVGSPCGTYGFNDEKLQAKYARLKITDENSYNYNVLGLWGVVQTGLEFIDNFAKVKDTVVVPTPYKENLAVHVSFDQNNFPRATAICMQLDRRGGGKYDIRLFKEICLPPPTNSTEDICTHYQESRPEGFRMPVPFIYGDASGGHERQRIKKSDAKHHYDFVFNFFNNHKKDRVIKRNPPRAGVRKAIKDLLWEENGHRLMIDPSLEYLIGDMIHLQVGPDGGGYFKHKVKDPKTKRSFERHGHSLDSLIYMLYYLWPEWFSSEY